MSTVSQRSFSGGEQTPSMQARVDFNKYQTSLKTMRNFVSLKHGGAENRSGSVYVAEVKDSSKAVRLIPFDAGSGAAYILEFGDQYIRFHKGKTQVRLASQAISNITNTNPAVVTYVGADTYSNGDEVRISGLTGDLNNFLGNLNFKIAGVNTGANTFQLKYMDGSFVNSTALPVYISQGIIEEVYEISSPYLEADLFDLQFAQSVDVMSIVHPNYAPRKLNRFADTNWTLITNSLNSEIPVPTGLKVKDATGGTGSFPLRYIVTAIRKSDGRESMPGIATLTSNPAGYSAEPLPRSVSSITNALSPTVTLATSSSYFPTANPDNLVLISGGAGMDEIKDRRYFAKGPGSGTTTNIQNEDSTNFSAYTSGATMYGCYVATGAASALSSTNYTIVEWDYDDLDVREFNIYRSNGDGGTYGLIGVTTSGKSFKDIGVDQDFSKKPPFDVNLFRTTNNYPSCVAYSQQRLLYANTNNKKETVFGSRISDFDSFQASSPIQDDDAITFKAAGKKFNPIRHILDLSKVVLMTETSEIVVNPDGSIITSSNINLAPQSYNGSSKVPPIIINENALYIQSKGSIVRDLLFNFNIDGFSGNDISIFANHLFEGYTILDWCFAQVPNSNVWAVRSDGLLLCLTYLKEQQVLAWGKHDFTDGSVESVASIPATSKDDVYLLVNRTIDGRTTRYVEAFADRFIDRTIDKTVKVNGVTLTRQYDGIVDKKFLDSCLTRDGRNTSLTKTLTLSTGAGWTVNDTITITAAGTSFDATNVGNSYFIYLADGSKVRLLVTQYVSSSVVYASPQRDVPVEIQGIATTDWALAVNFMKNLWHLEGKSVSVFADGFVLANPNNPAYDVITVTDGAITLPINCALIHVGLPFTSDLETLKIETLQSETLIDKKIIIQEVNMNVEKTRGLWVGRQAPDDSISYVDGLIEVKARNDEGYEEPIDLTSDPLSVIIDSNYNNNGRVFVRQIDPLPATILSIHPSGYIPFRGG